MLFNYNPRFAIILVMILYLPNGFCGSRAHFVNDANYIGHGDPPSRLRLGPIDAVYAWVNGSDPEWKKERDFWYERWTQDRGGSSQNIRNASTKTTPSLSDEGASDENHYRDSDELRYSIRSLEKYAPWIRQIYLVTNGQIPSWLERNNTRLKIVTHSEIFENSSNLPVFSSSAIESNLDRIPGLGEYFLYFNDDVFLGAPVEPEDFIEPSGAQTIYLSHPVPLSEDAYPEYWSKGKHPSKDSHDSECERDDYAFVDNGHEVKLEPLIGKVFLSSACDELQIHKMQSLLDKMFAGKITLQNHLGFTGLPLLQAPISSDLDTFNTTAEMPDLDTTSRIKLAALLDAFSQCPSDHDLVSDAIRSVIKAFNERFSLSKHLRRVPSHMPHMINKRVLAELKEIFKHEFEMNSAHKFRHPQDLQVSFAYFDYLINRPYFLSSVMGEPRSQRFDMNYTILQSNSTKQKEYALKMGTDVTFHMLGDDHQSTMEQLQSTRDNPTKFICLNDDMKMPSVDVRLAIAELLEDLWPDPSSFELQTTPVKYEGPQKPLSPEGGILSIICVFILLSATFAKPTSVAQWVHRKVKAQLWRFQTLFD